MYLIGLLIDILALGSESGAEDADGSLAVGESHSKRAATDAAETVIAFFFGTMRQVLCDHTPGIREGMLSFNEEPSMLGLVIEVLQTEAEGFLKDPAMNLAAKELAEDQAHRLFL